MTDPMKLYSHYILFNLSSELNTLSLKGRQKKWTHVIFNQFTNSFIAAHLRVDIQFLFPQDGKRSLNLLLKNSLCCTSSAKEVKFTKSVQGGKRQIKRERGGIVSHKNSK